MTETLSITDVIPMPASLEDLPDPDPFYFVAGRKSNFIVKHTIFGKVIAPIKELTTLPEHEATLWHEIPRLPAALVSSIWAFFVAAWETKHAEALVHLLYRDGEWSAYVPEQEVTGTSVHAKLDGNDIPEGWIDAGTIHSHCNFGAFHSTTDENDARKHDGLHLTIGEVDKDVPQIDTMIALNGTLWSHWDYDQIIDGPLIKPATFPAEWLTKIADPKPVPIVPTKWQPGQFRPPTQIRNTKPHWSGNIGTYHYNYGGWSDDEYGLYYPTYRRNGIGARTDTDVISLATELHVAGWRHKTQRPIEHANNLIEATAGLESIVDTIESLGFDVDITFSPRENDFETERPTP